MALSALLLDLKTRYVRTAAGAEKYGQPIGTPIVPDAPDVPTLPHSPSASTRPVQGSVRPARTRISSDTMHEANDEERQLFGTIVGRPIPPAWTNVRISNDILNPNTRVLAQGRDAKGRIQTIYSSNHIEGQTQAKFERIKRLSTRIDDLDETLNDLYLDDDDAAALLLIRRLGMRPGSDKDTFAAQQAFGATNLQARHVNVSNTGYVRFDFVGKKGVDITLTTRDAQIAELMRDRLQGKSGTDRLFNTDDRRVTSQLRAIVGEDFYVKDLRTLRANEVALSEVAKRKRPSVPKNKTEFRKWRKEVAVAVSNQLGNTPTVALADYINPTVFSKWIEGNPEWL